MNRVYRIRIKLSIGTEGILTEIGPMSKLTDAIALCEERGWPLDHIETSIESRSYSEWKKAMPE